MPSDRVGFSVQNFARALASLEEFLAEIVQRIRTSYFATLQAAVARMQTQYTDCS